MIKAADFMHPEDVAAIRQLQNIPGFVALSKKVLELGYEKYRYGLNMASAIRLSPTQLPKLYNRLPPICEKLGMPVPEFYLQMNPKPNAASSGIKRKYIRMTSGLLEYMNDEEIDALLAHECGHLICDHNVYRSLIDYLSDGKDESGILGSLAKPIQYALLSWYRKSELSCDRCASIVTSPEVVARVMARFAGGPYRLTKDLNMEEWLEQAEKYEEISRNSNWDKTLKNLYTWKRTHPYDLVRVREVMKWGKSVQYKNLKESMLAKESGKHCSKCGMSVVASWGYCKYCGEKL